MRGRRHTGGVKSRLTGVHHVGRLDEGVSARLVRVGEGIGHGTGGITPTQDTCLQNRGNLHYGRDVTSVSGVGNTVHQRRVGGTTGRSGHNPVQSLGEKGWLRVVLRGPQ